MKNKVLIHILVPELDENFDIFIPVNELIWKIKKLLLKSISDITGVPLNNEYEYVLLNKDTNRIYQSNEQVINTDIRNGTEIFIISKSN